ncbi:UDP-3-O-acyl-N-acetylglucosamine deacetylase [Verrucomicrobiota bacterium]
MTDKPYGTIIAGDKERVLRACEEFSQQPVDQEMISQSGDRKRSDRQITLGKAVSVSGSGTFFGHARRTLTFEPTANHGWWLDRSDLPGSMPIRVAVNNVWTTARNIVLCSGSPHNYIRMVEHIIALKAGMSLDNVIIRMDSGDPPLFDRSSMDLVEAVNEAGLIEQENKAIYVTVKEPVTIGGNNGSFLTFLPAEKESRELLVDCAINFRSAIGKQRIRFTVDNDTFHHAALARTNTTLGMMIYCKTIGKIFADVRNLGYTTKNISIAGPRHYFNKPSLMHNGKSLEAAWHRATLDLLAAVALIDRGRFAGKIISYKAGHSLDVQMIRELHKHNLLAKL